MDTGARIQRFIVAELGAALKQKWMTNRFVATILAVGPAVPLVLLGKSVWGPLWTLFGTTNQLIGGMTFLVLFVYLFRTGRPLFHYAIPMVFVVLVTTGAMLVNLFGWWSSLGPESGPGNWTTFIVGLVILVLEIWMIVEAILICLKLKGDRESAQAPAS